MPQKIRPGFLHPSKVRKAHENKGESHISSRLSPTRFAEEPMFGGKTKVESGLSWYEYGRLTYTKLRTHLSIAYGEISTHNHFVLDRGGNVFNRTAPVIKLTADSTEDDHIALLGVLNSSTACFYLRKVCYNKGLRLMWGNWWELGPVSLSGWRPRPCIPLSGRDLRQDDSISHGGYAGQHHQLTDMSQVYLVSNLA